MLATGRENDCSCASLGSQPGLAGGLLGMGGTTHMTEPHEILTPEELADEQADGVDLGDQEPEEVPDPAEEDTSGIELGDPDQFEAMRSERQGGGG